MNKKSVSAKEKNHIKVLIDEAYSCTKVLKHQPSLNIIIKFIKTNSVMRNYLDKKMTCLKNPIPV